jgi:16S rRNA processing protein RimM
MELVKIGIIVNTFGIRGELKINPLTDFAEKRFKADQQLYICKDEKFEPVVVKSFRMHKGFALVLFHGLENINLVEKYKNCEIFIAKDDVHKLNKGEYYYFELKGCAVYSDNKFIGTVSGVDSGYQTILRIGNDEGKQVLIPYVDAFIKNVNIENKRIDVNVIEGML